MRNKLSPGARCADCAYPFGFEQTNVYPKTALLVFVRLVNRIKEYWSTFCGDLRRQKVAGYRFFWYVLARLPGELSISLPLYLEGQVPLGFYMMS